MNEKQWLACIHPDLMLRFLRDGGKANDRKVRLFASASCRSVWHLLVHEASRNAIDVFERFADGQAEDYDRGMARNAADRAAQEIAHRVSGLYPHLPVVPGLDTSHVHAAYAAADAAQPKVWDAVKLASDQVMSALRHHAGHRQGSYDEVCLQQPPCSATSLARSRSAR
jgi:hypothetical protein